VSHEVDLSGQTVASEEENGRADDGAGSADIDGFSARRAIVTLRARGVDPAPLLSRAGLTYFDFDNPQHRISAAAQSLFLEAAADALSDSAFGLHLAEEASPREAGLPFYVASAAKNVSEALALFARYCRIVNEAMRVKLTPAPDGAVVEVGYVDLPWRGAMHLVEFAVAAMVKGLREVTGRNVRPRQVAFPHGRNVNLREFERFFGCPVEFGASSEQLAFSTETLAFPLITQDRHLLEMLRPICDEAEQQRSTAAGTLRAAIEHEVQKLLPQGKAQRENVAKKLAMSPRTLSRRLADEGTTYEEVVDGLRRSLALEYVKELSISLSQIAWLLGYEGATSFNHAFKRWTGRSPSAARNDRLLLSSERC
jgi:AraC-like DNA-binding protein